MLSSNRYTGLSTLNHWIAALLVVSMLVLGLTMAAAPDEAGDYIEEVHISLGFFALLVVLWRVGYRVYQGFPENVGTAAWERWAAWSVHRLLLVSLTFQVLTGPLYLFTENEGINVFGWFTVSIPLGFVGEAVHEGMEAIHVFNGTYLLTTLLVLHFLGAIRHYWNESVRAPSDL